MKLTGKALGHFEEWYRNQGFPMGTYSTCGSTYETVGFDDLPEAMQWGVLVDFGITLGLFMNVGLDEDEAGIYWELIERKRITIPSYPYADITVKRIDCVSSYGTIDEARAAAIEKLNEIINNK